MKQVAQSSLAQPSLVEPNGSSAKKSRLIVSNRLWTLKPSAVVRQNSKKEGKRWMHSRFYPPRQPGYSATEGEWWGLQQAGISSFKIIYFCVLFFAPQITSKQPIQLSSTSTISPVISHNINSSTEPAPFSTFVLIEGKKRATLSLLPADEHAIFLQSLRTVSEKKTFMLCGSVGCIERNSLSASTIGWEAAGRA